MKVEQLMTKDIKTCRPEDTLKAAALIMWNNDCGIVPVVDENSQVVSVITDRDICMAGCFQDARLGDLPVAKTMSKEVFSCRPNDSIQTAEKLMRQHQVRRLPVIPANGRVLGLISFNDIVRESENERERGVGRQVNAEEITETLAAICARHTAGAIVATA